jgi:hypothetical protein
MSRIFIAHALNFDIKVGRNELLSYFVAEVVRSVAGGSFELEQVALGGGVVIQICMMKGHAGA